MSKKSRRPLTKTQTKGSGGGSRAAAVGFFALLPIAVALGVVVGRSGGSGDSNEDALLKALHQAEQQQVAAAPVVTEEETATTASTANKAKGATKSAKNGGKAAAKNEAKNAAKSAGTNATKSKQGAVEKIETYKPSKEDVEEDTKLVEENPEQTGENYIKAQQNLPEVIVVGGGEEGSSSSSELPPGVEP
jgi:primosomal protein N'